MIACPTCGMHGCEDGLLCGPEEEKMPGRTISEMGAADEIRALREENRRLREVNDAERRRVIAEMQEERRARIRAVVLSVMKVSVAVFFGLTVLVAAGRGFYKTGVNEGVKQYKHEATQIQVACQSACEAHMGSMENVAEGHVNSGECHCYTGENGATLTGAILTQTFEAHKALQRDMERIRRENR